MGFLNIEKNNNNNQGTYFDQNPNMMGNNQYPNNMYNQPMMNQGMPQQPMPNYNNQYQNQGMMNNMPQQQMIQPQMNQMVSPQVNQQPMMQPGQPVQQPAVYNQNMMNAPQYNQLQQSTGEMSKYVDPNPTPNDNVISGSPSKVDSQPSLSEESKNTLNYYNEKIAKQESEALAQQESIETLDDELQLPREAEEVKETTPEADPLNNDSNPVPVNPILAQMDKYQDVEDIGDQKDVKANIFAAFGIILGMIIKPGTTMLKNAKKFKKMDKAFMIMLWLALIFLVTTIAVRVLVGSFDRSYSSLSDSYKLVFNPARIFELSNYLEYILITVSVSIGGVLLVALIYYASSFLNSKGVHFATYLIVSNLGLIPLIAGSIILYPIAMIFSGYLAIGVLIFAFLATVITLLIGMNEVLKFNSINNQIFYHVINLSIITLVAIMVFVFMVHQGWVILPQVSI